MSTVGSHPYRRRRVTHSTNAQAANTVMLTTLDIQLACIFASSQLPIPFPYRRGNLHYIANSSTMQTHFSPGLAAIDTFTKAVL